MITKHCLLTLTLVAIPHLWLASIKNTKPSVSQDTKSTLNEPFWDEYGTRYQLVQSNSGSYNWLFVPGGPGADSCYFLPLIQALKLPGKTWLIDFPGNGSNRDPHEAGSVFDTWSTCLLACTKKFENPVYVGHSFGGMFALLFPELEKLLRGLVIIGASPTIDMQENERMIKERNYVMDNEPSQQFRKNPTDQTLQDALLARSPCHFPPTSLHEGQKLFSNLPFNAQAMIWWIKKVSDTNYNASWVPLHVPTLIMGGSEDCINPITLFQRDQRFKRDNIALKVLDGSGHFPWLENLETIKTIIEKYILENLSH